MGPKGTFSLVAVMLLNVRGISLCCGCRDVDANESERIMTIMNRPVMEMQLMAR